MYFDFEDYHPDIAVVGRALTRLEVVLLTIIFHLLVVIAILLAPRYFPELFVPAERPTQLALAPQQDHTQFVFVAPRIERPVPKPPPNAEPSDLNREARTPFKAPTPQNPLPFNRGNSPERVDAPAERPQVARGQGPQPEPQQMARNSQPNQPQIDSSVPRMSESSSSLQLPSNRSTQPSNTNGRSATPGGNLGDALRNLQRYVQNEQFENPGGGGQFGPEIQFDTKGVEFGPWIRRFIAQVKRNWFIPYAAMSQRGHVVISFNIHKDGSITDLNVVGPSGIDAFNSAAFGALSGSNPTQPLPPEYPADKAFFTVTFYYNEQPPR
ncbi:MAG TPA: TonB family protein [Vicinamibacterales bacterium]|nr:TonB family protein [Vicinamibacterales bacterium]